jgi:hypothetical protein
MHPAKKDREIHRYQIRSDGEEVLSAQADAFVGTKAEEKIGLFRSVP